MDRVHSKNISDYLNIYPFPRQTNAFPVNGVYGLKAFEDDRGGVRSREQA